ncbi:uncharacterized protein DDB_G0271670 [Anopheles ziemanni]|uniref:uncharacterized protein DDB_G0271670 n=1 Tax=Anopheles coustani TaxID=139045 RepID=UPI002658F96E|nr:uncharacterized protein DDB_G0271670 [Anopheles coustani]XP_058171866.1 uncharacterized protein DDB_G0271670 [Anopheles ziemanni]
MPSKKKKYNARFPAGRIKKIMQTDEEVGKVAQAVPVIISRTLELFVESLLTKTLKVTNARNAKTLSPSHMKQCIISESRFDFLRDLVKNIPDIGINEDLSGSEAGYGAEGTSPASTSTSSSSVSFSNGGNPAVGGTFHHQQHYDSPTMLQRSESYSPASATSMVGQNSHHHPKRQASVSQTASLNFYKEIPLEGTSSPPPPKLTRLNSAPAGGAPATTVPRLPFKIDILPNLPPAGTTPSTASKHTTIGAITPQISYKFERLSSSSASSPTAATTLEPVIKLDYSNVKLPASSSATSSSTRGSTTIQPTIKIDLSSLATASFTTTDGSTPTTPKHLATSGGSSSSSSSSKHQHHATTSSSSSSTPATTPIIQSPLSAAPPIYSAMSSTIPGMDEDYDDI